MALSVNRSGRQAGFLGSWAWPGRDHGIDSADAAMLRRELTRYLRGEVAGRSFLIAGHRGIGKTTLVRHAVETVEHGVLDAAEKAATGSPVGGDAAEAAWPRQRPLLVKIHGPSLLAAAAPKRGDTPPAEAAAHAAVAATTAAFAAAGLRPPGPPPRPRAALPAAAPPAPSVEERAQNALIHITIALYRALAGEVALCFARHARWLAGLLVPRPGDPPGTPRARAEQLGLPPAMAREAPELLEVATQLALELDSAPDTALLRLHWQRLNRLEAGILWPAATGTWRAGLPGQADRGLREIATIATAAQAFQVCAGTVTAAERRTATAAAEAAVEGKGELGREAVRAIFGLGAGAMVGFGLAGAQAGAASAVAGGAAAALLGAMGFGWSARRGLKTDLGRDYTFLPDRSAQSLDRDLPLVIRRLREIGLSPVFVVDELDKLPDPAEAVRAIIHRLKHLTTDDGLFCFLTDRDSFEALRPRQDGRAFPVDHTLFSHRLLLLYRPAEVAAYLRRVLVTDAPPDPPGGPVTGLRPRELLALRVAARRLMARSRLNTIDLDRGLAELDPAAAVDTADRLHALVQIALHRVLAEEARARRFAADPIFAQLLLDTLYMPHRLWQRGMARLPVDQRALVVHLLERMGRDPGRDPEAVFAASYPDCEAATLHAALVEMLGFLQDADRLKAAVLAADDLLAPSVQGAFEASAVWPPEPRILDETPAADLLLAEDAAILRGLSPPPDALLDSAGDGAGLRFRYDRQGAFLPLPPPPVAVVATVPAMVAPAAPPDLLEGLRTLAATPLGLGLEEMTGFGLLPSGLDAEALAKPEVAEAIATQLGQRFAGFAMAAWLAMRVVLDLRMAGVKPAQPAQIALDALARYLPLGRLAGSARTEDAAALVVPLLPDAVPVEDLPRLKAVADRPADTPDRLAGALAALAALLTAEQDVYPQRPPAEVLEPSRAWERWQANIGQRFGGPTHPLRPETRWADVVLAALDRAPGSVFRGRWAEMRAADWAWLCALAFPAEPDARPEAPDWALAAGLRGLGFGRPDIVLALLRNSDNTPETTQFVQGAPLTTQPGLIVLMREVESAYDRPMGETPPAVPIFPVRRGRRARYDEVLDWMTEYRLVEDSLDEQ